MQQEQLNPIVLQEEQLIPIIHEEVLNQEVVIPDVIAKYIAAYQVYQQKSGNSFQEEINNLCSEMALHIKEIQKEQDKALLNKNWQAVDEMNNKINLFNQVSVLQQNFFLIFKSSFNTEMLDLFVESIKIFQNLQISNIKQFSFLECPGIMYGFAQYHRKGKTDEMAELLDYDFQVLAWTYIMKIKFMMDIELFKLQG